MKATSGDLARLGFVDATAALAHLTSLGESADPLVALLGRTADPDQALAELLRLLDAVHDRDGAEGRGELLDALVHDEGTAMRLLCVLGASEALAHHLTRHPEQWRELRDPTMGSTRPAAYAVRAGLLLAVGAEPSDAVPVATVEDAAAVDALRVEYRRVLLRLAARDLAHDLGVDDAAAELSDLAAGTLEAALAIARARLGEAAAEARLGVVAMGKCGGHELNYVSDVDVIFLHAATDPERQDDPSVLRTATRLATHLIQICSDYTGEGTIWPVDAALRPEGKAGPLTRTLESHEGYYERWAKPWEFQALLKARAVAGDLALGQAFVDMTAPMVWTAAQREGFVTDTQAMRRRVIEHIPAKEVDRQIKLGPGGLRDVEFAVQLLQLVHGFGDDRIREPTTLSALHALAVHGYVGRQDGESLHEAYSFLRSLEHRMQLFALRRTHVVPEDSASLRRLGRSLGYRTEPEETLAKVWQHHRREVRRLHEKLFYRPLLAAVARVHTDEVRLSSEAAGARLAALGYG
ncbi:MAG: bifunctional [glutamine synthetase] adenylyltransferase/[glutamine synthetase]-adenylyl-L-tyrosine phosphorylase, partial [Actinobacteria bacterium]|nr:bifunctional [glutamine synthetase] adenylyltransferase/[glutamine synthetase]-adenylyl-L-tyrosine phosphorylase [Actinomycetota bacterium]